MIRSKQLINGFVLILSFSRYVIAKVQVTFSNRSNRNNDDLGSKYWQKYFSCFFANQPTIFAWTTETNELSQGNETKLTEKLSKKGRNVLSTNIASLHLSGFACLECTWLTEHIEATFWFETDKTVQTNKNESFLHFPVLSLASQQQRRRLCTFGNLYFHFSKPSANYYFYALLMIQIQNHATGLPQNIDRIMYLSQNVVAETKWYRSDL